MKALLTDRLQRRREFWEMCARLQGNAPFFKGHSGDPPAPTENSRIYIIFFSFCNSNHSPSCLFLRT
uniref:Uncharacterized protein n=1 Tax=Anguilla anguilla TaxID=7936 RepID=A0A0E9XT40_ANGAN